MPSSPCRCSTAEGPRSQKRPIAFAPVFDPPVPPPSTAPVLTHVFWCLHKGVEVIPGPCQPKSLGAGHIQPGPTALVMSRQTRMTSIGGVPRSLGRVVYLRPCWRAPPFPSSRGNCYVRHVGGRFLPCYAVLHISLLWNPFPSGYCNAVSATAHSLCGNNAKSDLVSIWGGGAFVPLLGRFSNSTWMKNFA